jgi:hypothetical protein
MVCSFLDDKNGIPLQKGRAIMFENKLTPSLQSPEGVIRPSLLAIATDDNLDVIAKHIIERLENEAVCGEDLEFDFHIQGSTGKMFVSQQFADKNVWYKFDTRKSTVLDDLKRVEFEADCNVAEYDFIDEYHAKIAKTLLNKYSAEMQTALITKIFKGKDMPLQLLAVCKFEMTDFSDLGDEGASQISIEKAVPKSQIDNSQGIAEELYRLHDQTGKSFAAIVEEKKAAGDPKYKYVVGVQANKMYWECQVDLFVDFSSDSPLGEAPKAA